MAFGRPFSADFTRSDSDLLSLTRNSPAGAWGRRRRCEHWAVSLFEVVESVLQKDDESQTEYLAETYNMINTFGNFEIWKIRDFSKSENFEIWNLKILKSEIWKIRRKFSKFFDPTFFWRRIFPIGQKINDRLAMELRSFLEPFPVRATEGEVFLKYRISPKSLYSVHYSDLSQKWLPI